MGENTSLNRFVRFSAVIQSCQEIVLKGVANSVKLEIGATVYVACFD